MSLGCLGDLSDMHLNRRTSGRHWLALSGTLAAGALTAALLAAASSAAEEEKISIEGLLKAGWQVAGYTSTVDDRSTFILFRHANEPYLVQCRAGYDVTRTPRVTSNCYKLQ